MATNELNKIIETLLTEGSISLFLNSFNKGLIIINKEESITFVNKAAESFFNTSCVNLYGKNISDFLKFNKVSEVLSNANSFCSIEYNLNDKPVYISICPICINLDVFGAILVLNEEQDDLKSFSEIFNISITLNRELESLLNTTLDEIFITDGNGKIIKLNAACEKTYNLKSKELIGKNVADLEKENVFNPSVTLRVLKEKKKVSLLQKTSAGRTLIVSGFPIFDSDLNIIQVVSISKDVTDVYQLKEKLEEAEERAHNNYNVQILKQNTNQTNIIYKSQQMKEIMSLIERVANVNSTILITGETGVGKGVLAETIHKISNRCNNNFVDINCGAIPETLIESELFGYEKGAFTGARSEGKIGQIELADKGTLFLDEISELPFSMQVKLLKVLNDKKFMRIGGTKTITSDFRLIAATNKDLKTLVEEGKFREDLYYRLHVIPINIPPLTERKVDIIVLFRYFLDKYSKKYGKVKKISPEVYKAFLEYDWPGNVRELENCTERIIVTTEGNIITLDDIPSYIYKPQDEENKKEETFPDLKKALEQTEKQLILRAYQQYKNTYKVADVLGVSQPTIVRKVKKYNIN